jgi:hypothetical protein
MKIEENIQSHISILLTCVTSSQLLQDHKQLYPEMTDKFTGATDHLVPAVVVYGETSSIPFLQDLAINAKTRRLDMKRSLSEYTTLHNNQIFHVALLVGANSKATGLLTAHS